ncbi:MAG: [protein-PII] uridylyltransferase [Actinomycetes bacterium]
MPPALQRSHLIDDQSLTGVAFSDAYTALIDDWLVQLYDTAGGPATEVALVAVGGQGRRDMAPQSDLDVLLVIPQSGTHADLADSLWYPVWDTDLKLGHAVRTIRESLSLAAEDLETATALLSARHLAGDPSVTAALAEKARLNWRKRGKRWLEELARSVEERHQKVGDLAFELEPDLKESRGGLRDVHSLEWARLAGADLDPALIANLAPLHNELLEARIELHRATARPGDKLLLQEQDAIAARLGDADADALMGRLAEAGRTIAWTSDEAWHEIKLSLSGAFFDRFRRDRRLDDDLVLRGARVCLNDETTAVTDPVVVLRVALAAARQRTRVSRATLQLLTEAPPLPEPWPVAARSLFCELFLCGPSAIDVVETLDQWGIWEVIFPEWAPNRSLPQRNVFHRWTVDRHLLETASEAAALAPRTPRPDLLVMAALLHDIGKGYPGDHSEVGAELAAVVCRRMGFDEADVGSVVAAVRNHLLLPEVATRRDLDDPATIEAVAREVQTLDRLALFRALTEADAIATGSSAWGHWKAQLVEQLSNRTGHLLGGGRVDDVVRESFPSPSQRELLQAGRTQVLPDDDRVTVVCEDRPGVFWRVAGALALHGLDVAEASIHSEDGMVLDEFRVRISRSAVIPWAKVASDIERAIEGRLALNARLDERTRSHRRRHRPGMNQLVPRVRFDNDATPDSTVLEVFGPDSMGLLYRLTRAMAEFQLDVSTAKISTLGADVVDAFYVTDRDGGKLEDPALQEEIRRSLLHALEPAN